MHPDIFEHKGFIIEYVETNEGSGYWTARKETSEVPAFEADELGHVLRSIRLGA